MLGSILLMQYACVALARYRCEVVADSVNERGVCPITVLKKEIEVPVGTWELINYTAQGIPANRISEIKQCLSFCSGPLKTLCFLVFDFSETTKEIPSRHRAL